MYNEDIVLAVNVAIATGRPILVRGESGTGKSSLAENVADFLGWRYYEKTITSRTEARDLMWDVDLVRRLQDARGADARVTESYAPYLVPGVLWWAFDSKSARLRGTDPHRREVDELPDPQDGRGPRAVVLLDEIDKADPDVPNNLLVPLGSLTFTVDLTDTPVAVPRSRAPLMILTTNEERDFAPAFLRRCVELTLKRPDRRRLLEIAGAHFPAVDASRLQDLATNVLGPGAGDTESALSPAEFLDTVQAALDLKVDPASPMWRSLTDITAWKHGRARPQ